MLFILFSCVCVVKEYGWLIFDMGIFLKKNELLGNLIKNVFLYVNIIKMLFIWFLWS